MSLILPLAEDPEESAAKVLKEAEAHFDRAITALGELLNRLEAGEIKTKTETSATITDARRAMQTLFDERKKVEEQRRKSAGVVHDYALDFDAARDEIRVRLDRLRGSERSG